MASSVELATQDCTTSAEEQSTPRERLLVEYFIADPPCPRELRRAHRHTAAAHRRSRPSSSSTVDEPASRRSLPPTPTTESPGPGLSQRSAEFKRRMSPFRRGHQHERVKRPASATPMMSAEDPPVRPRPLHVEGHHDTAGTGSEASGDGSKEAWTGLQAMIRRRRTSSSSSGSSVASNLSVFDHHQQYQQVRTFTESSYFHHHHHYHRHSCWHWRYMLAV